MVMHICIHNFKNRTVINIKFLHIASTQLPPAGPSSIRGASGSSAPPGAIVIPGQPVSQQLLHQDPSLGPSSSAKIGSTSTTTAPVTYGPITGSKRVKKVARPGSAGSTRSAGSSRSSVN